MTRDVIISLFSGAGGLSLGFATAGLKPSAGFDFDRDACSSYGRNLGIDCFQGDLASPETVDMIVRSFGGGAAPLAIIGGPPCQGFSTAGSRGADDPRNRLIFAYLHVVERLMPSWVLFENVEGILTSAGGRSVRDFIRELIRLGYWVNLRKLNFAAYGLPQARKRVIIVGNRLGLGFEYPIAEHSYEALKHRSVNGLPMGPSLSDALAGLGNVAKNLGVLSRYRSGAPDNIYDSMMREGNDECGVRQHFAHKLSADDAERASRLKEGESLRHLPEAFWPESFRSRAYRRVKDGMPTSQRGGAPAGLKRLNRHQVALTITSFSWRELIHPEEDRPLSLRECARLQSFNDAFIFDGNAGSVARQIGNAFPPLASAKLAHSIQDHHFSSVRKRAVHGAPRLLDFDLTGSSGMSPALRDTQSLLKELQSGEAPRQTILMSFLEDDDLSSLNSAQRKLITKVRTAKPVRLSDREIARAVSVMLHDIGRRDLIPAFIEIPVDFQDYYHLPLAWFTQDEQRPFDLAKFFLQCLASVRDFETLLTCICELHKRRRKYDLILRGQPRPTMDQVARRGLLEFGIVPSPALSSWLVWRKWIYDIDNRSAQETGYLFEPIFAQALGGEPYGQRNSPIKRLDRAGGRQVDCLIDAGDEKRAYEFKVRFTIASSGQGRFAEELSFPKEAAAVGYVPVLIVLDPTENEKLTVLAAAFRESGGETYLGQQAWDHIGERAGPTMAAFLETYVRAPIESVVKDSEAASLGELLVGWDDDAIRVSVGGQEWRFDRRAETTLSAELDDDDLDNSP